MMHNSPNRVVNYHIFQNKGNYRVIPIYGERYRGYGDTVWEVPPGCALSTSGSGCGRIGRRGSGGSGFRGRYVGARGGGDSNLGQERLQGGGTGSSHVGDGVADFTDGNPGRSPCRGGDLASGGLDTVKGKLLPRYRSCGDGVEGDGGDFQFLTHRLHHLP